MLFQAVKHPNNTWSYHQSTLFLQNPRTGQYQLGMFLKLNKKGKRVHNAGKYSHEENYSLVCSQYGCKIKDINSSTSFRNNTNQQPPYNISKLVGISHIYEKNMRNVSYSGTLNVLMLIIWSNLDGSPI